MLSAIVSKIIFGREKNQLSTNLFIFGVTRVGVYLFFSAIFHSKTYESFRR